MSNIYNEQELEDIQNYVLEQDRKGLLEDEISHISFANGLHPDDDREEVIQILAEYIFEERHA